MIETVIGLLFAGIFVAIAFCIKIMWVCTVGLTIFFFKCVLLPVKIFFH